MSSADGEGLDINDLPDEYRRKLKAWLEGGRVKEQECVDDAQGLTVPEAAQRLRCSPGTIRKLIRTGQLKSHRVGRLLRTTPADIREFIEAQRHSSPHGLNARLASNERLSIDDKGLSQHQKSVILRMAAGACLEGLTFDSTDWASLEGKVINSRTIKKLLAMGFIERVGSPDSWRFTYELTALGKRLVSTTKGI